MDPHSNLTTKLRYALNSFSSECFHLQRSKFFLLCNDGLAACVVISLNQKIQFNSTKEYGRLCFVNYPYKKYVEFFGIDHCHNDSIKPFGILPMYGF